MLPTLGVVEMDVKKGLKLLVVCGFARQTHSHLCHVHSIWDCRHRPAPAVVKCGPDLWYLVPLCCGVILSLVLLTKGIWS